mmetsp:Transcript_76/g.634  ORF Transcript_76/g.634 Transcript_76/m.634 type:complete len:133 (-) Transcript_76:1074-1472(-)
MHRPTWAHVRIPPTPPATHDRSVFPNYHRDVRPFPSGFKSAWVPTLADRENLRKRKARTVGPSVVLLYVLMMHGHSLDVSVGTHGWHQSRVAQVRRWIHSHVMVASEGMLASDGRVPRRGLVVVDAGDVMDA